MTETKASMQPFADPRAEDIALDARSLYSLGLSYHHTGDHVKASTTLKRALEMGLDDREAASAQKVLDSVTE